MRKDRTDQLEDADYLYAALNYQGRALRQAYWATQRCDARTTERWLRIAERYGRLHIQIDAIEQVLAMQDDEARQKQIDYEDRTAPPLFTPMDRSPGRKAFP